MPNKDLETHLSPITKLDRADSNKLVQRDFMTPENRIGGIWDN